MGKAAFYNAVKSVYGPQKCNITPVRSENSLVLFKVKQEILQCWAEHFNSLLNSINPANPSVIESLPHSPLATLLDEPPDLTEVLSAVRNLKK